MSVIPRRFGGYNIVFLLLGLLSAKHALHAQAARESGAPAIPLTQRQPFIVGAFTDAYPYSYVEKDDKLVGFAVDVLDAVAKAENLSLIHI